MLDLIVDFPLSVINSRNLQTYLVTGAVYDLTLKTDPEPVIVSVKNWKLYQ